MYQDAFQKLDQDETEKFLNRAQPHLDGIGFNIVNVTVLSHALPFYEGYTFYDIGDFSSAKPLHRYIIANDDHISVLDWTNTPIHKLNKDAPLALNEENLGDYVRFYFSYVRGDKGKFILCENVDDIPWKDDPPPSSRKSVGSMITPLTLVEGHGNDGEFHLEGTICFKNGLFKVDMIVQSDGMLEITNQELLLEDLPILDDVFNQ